MFKNLRFFWVSLQYLKNKEARQNIKEGAGGGEKNKGMLSSHAVDLFLWFV